LAVAALLSLSIHATAIAQTAAAESKPALAVVHRLFDAMRAGDSAGVRSAFHPAAQFATTAVRDGSPVVKIDTLDAFVRAVGTPHTEVWDERLRNEVVHVDGPLAVVWADY
jgi:ketosteroid isomerase-like protein